VPPTFLADRRTRCLITTRRNDIKLVKDGPDAVAEARKLHHLATADPERDGTLTGPAHEEKYGLERAEGSAASGVPVAFTRLRTGRLSLAMRVTTLRRKPAKFLLRPRTLRSRRTPRRLASRSSTNPQAPAPVGACGIPKQPAKGT
jgi:hypothetical protein